MKKQLNAGSVAQRKTLGRIEEEKQRRAREDWLFLLSDSRGRRLFYSIINDYCRLQSVSLARNSEIYVHEGMRTVAADLLEMARSVSPRAYTLAMHEAAAESLAELEATEVAIVAASNEEDDIDG